MNSIHQISAVKLRDYAKGQGWELFQEAIRDRLYVMEHPQFKKRQLVFAMEESAPDYEQSLLLAAESLAETVGLPLAQVLNRIDEAPDDTLQFRVLGDAVLDSGLPLSFTGSVLTGVQQLLLAAAHTVVSPQKHHPRLARGEALAFLEAANFRHTQHGSFIFTVSCPVFAMEDQIPLLVGGESDPFVRRTTLVIKRALQQLVTAIEADKIDELVDSTNRQKGPLLSANFCEALMHFQDGRFKNSLSVSFAWAASVRAPEIEQDERPINIQRDYFPRIEEIYLALRSTEQHKEGSFVGTVERLNGEMGDDGRRSGDVDFSLLLEDGDSIRARSVLDADQYEDADKAHMSKDLRVVVRGTLHPGRQPRALTNITYLKLLNLNEQ